MYVNSHTSLRNEQRIAVVRELGKQMKTPSIDLYYTDFPPQNFTRWQGMGLFPSRPMARCFSGSPCFPSKSSMFTPRAVEHTLHQAAQPHSLVSVESSSAHKASSSFSHTSEDKITLLCNKKPTLSVFQKRRGEEKKKKKNLKYLIMTEGNGDLLSRTQ